MYTTHGHQIPGTPVTGLQPLRARCGGLGRCEQCAREAAKVLVDSERDHHHILIGLSMKTAGTDQKIRSLLANAIGWAFFGKKGEEKVDISAEDTVKCKIAAERCMVALREYRRISGEELGDVEREDGNLVAHARYELELLNTDEDMKNCLIEAVRGFASFGHSGESASWAIPVLNDLLQYKALSPLTNNPNEWMVVAGHDDNPRLWQSRRQSDAFSEDGGQTYRCLNEDNFVLHKSARVDVGVRDLEESDVPSVSGGSGQESAPDEQEPEDLGESQESDESEASKEGLHGI